MPQTPKRKKPRNEAATDTTRINLRATKKRIAALTFKADRAYALSLFLESQLEQVAKRVKKLEGRT